MQSSASNSFGFPDISLFLVNISRFFQASGRTVKNKPDSHISLTVAVARSTRSAKRKHCGRTTRRQHGTLTVCVLLTVKLFERLEFLNQRLVLILQHGDAVLQTLDVLFLLPSALLGRLPVSHKPTTISQTLLLTVSPVRSETLGLQQVITDVQQHRNCNITDTLKVTKKHTAFTTNNFIVHTHTRLMALFRDYPGEPVPEK